MTDESLFPGYTVSELEVNFVVTLSMWSTQQVSSQTRLWSQCEPHCRNFPLLILCRLCERFTVTISITYFFHLKWSLCVPVCCIFSLFSIVVLGNSPSHFCFGLGHCCLHHILICFLFIRSSWCAPCCHRFTLW